MGKHPTVMMMDPFSRTDIKIDEKIAPLVSALWDAGIMTEQSCQEDRPGYAWIVFGDHEEALQFLGIILGKRPDFEDSFIKAISHWDVAGPQNGYVEPGEWDWAVHPTVDQEGVWSFLTSVSIPVEHLAEVTDRLRKDIESR